MIRFIIRACRLRRRRPVIYYYYSHNPIIKLPKIIYEKLLVFYLQITLIILCFHESLRLCAFAVNLPEREALRWKARKDGRRCAAAEKKRPEEALFAALRAHGYRLRTWNRTPTAKPARPNNKHKINKKSKLMSSLFQEVPLG